MLSLSLAVVAAVSPRLNLPGRPLLSPPFPPGVDGGVPRPGQPVLGPRAGRGGRVAERAHVLPLHARPPWAHDDRAGQRVGRALRPGQAGRPGQLGERVAARVADAAALEEEVRLGTRPGLPRQVRERLDRQGREGDEGWGSEGYFSESRFSVPG